MSSREHPAVAVAPHPDLLAYYANASVKRGFLRRIFDDGARDYDHVERLLSLGKGSQYRREALVRAGLGAGMRVLDVAVGTGLVAREAIGLTGDPRLVFGLDPSPGMMRQAVESLKIAAVLGVGEQIPLASGQFDFLSMGYGLRHLADLARAFSEFFRVLRPGGRLCVLEITAPDNRIARMVLRGHMRCVVPLLTRLTTGRANSQLLWQYYWDTIEACVRPQTVMDGLRNAGFDCVQRHEVFGIFSEYTAIKPPQ